MKLLGAAADVTSVLTTIRIARPLTELIAQRPGWELTLRSLHECSAADLEWADVLIVQRGLTRRAWRLICAMHASGGRVIYEIDDLLSEMPPSLIHHAAVRRGLPWLQRCIAAADIVSVSTARLGRTVAPPRWVEVPNYGDALPQAVGASRAVDAAGTPVTLLFASSDRVPVQQVALALRELQALPGRTGPVVAVGPVAEDLRSSGVAVRPLPQIARLDFLSLLRSLGPVLAVIPIGSTSFDSCKSAIKYFDYALAGIPVVCANRPPYSDVTRDGVDVLLVEDLAKAWRAAIEIAIDEPERMAALVAAAALAVASHHSLDQTVSAWSAVLDELGPRTAAAQAAVNPWQRAVEAAAIWLRRFNRNRLARRAATRALKGR